MMLFIVRHAHAVDAAENPERPLSRRGREQVRRCAAFLKKSGALACDEVWHSPLTRSCETAERLVKGLELRAKLVVVEGLEGNDDPATIVTRLKHRRAPLAIVGHEPHLGALTTLLVAGAADPTRFALKKCSVIALAREARRWVVRWQISPEIVVG